MTIQGTALLDRNGNPLAVCLRTLGGMGDTLKIYRTKPEFPGQQPSKRRYKSEIPLYTYCKVEREQGLVSRVKTVSFENELHPYPIRDAGGISSMIRVVHRFGVPAARMEGGTNMGWK